MADSNSNQIRWGIIAPGRIAHRFAQSFTSITDGVIAGVASSNEGRANAFASEYTIEKVYTDYQSLIQDPEIDAVYIATPHRFHFEICQMAILAKKAILCEKPLTVTSAHSEHLFELAKSHDVFLMEALWSRFLPVWIEVKKWVQQGKIGRLQHFKSSFGFKAERNNDDRLFNIELAGGSLLDTGVYNIALTDFLVGQSPERIQSNVIVGQTGVDEQCQVTLHYPNLTSEFTCSLLESLPNTFEIIGDKGTITVEANFWEAETARLKVTGSASKTLNIPFDKNGFEYQVREVHQCLNESRITSEEMTPEVTIRNMKVMDEILAAAGVKYPFINE
ncbi:Gfo/Idh/MocA family oxidoreductase [Vibrio sp. 10N.261.55.A7]|uniref:Gfo/Idh/MocA family protein n=1 Tax=Vibrio sp. 10N.261.55.A7 TaxID=1880851 RepID=UPI000C85AA5E|nr:Gfo/Idh/MocA family oxidoreductase [Vibrio sp. 10N.261.55.A7]PMJ93144.1 dehydrogenase [Vibrio sp. 10N.261.55.A7]